MMLYSFSNMYNFSVSEIHSENHHSAFINHHFLIISSKPQQVRIAQFRN